MNLFVLGIISTILTAMLSVIVVGIVKILKLQRQINEMNLSYYRDMDHIHRRIEDSNSELWRQFETAGRDVTMVEKTIMNQIDKTRKEMDQAIDQLNRIDGELNENARRYTDSRIDKLIDTYFDMVGSKKIIKG